jgi:predicted nucleotidyltransferase
MTAFDALLRVLSEHGIEFILIGGAAAIAHGSARFTEDLDVVYERSPENLMRIVDALAPYQPYPRGAPAGLPFVWDVATLKRGMNFTLTTQLGDFDLFGEIPGGGTYAELAGGAIAIELFGVRCLCLSLAQLIRAKRTTGRPKDLEALAELQAIEDERDRLR